MKEKAWSLLVVSSEAQSDTLPHQRAWAEQTAKERGWRITRVFEGVASGKEGPRRIVRDLLAELREIKPEGRPAWILMLRLDRLGRGSIIESQIVVHELRDLGVRVWTRDAGEVRLDSAMQELIVAAQSAVSRQENEVRIDKALATYRQKRAAGAVIGNRRAYGLKLHDGKDVADGKRAEAVREAFKLRAGGLGYYAIALRLSEFAPPYSFKKPKDDGNRDRPVHWTPGRVLRLLLNKAYIGPVITEKQFHEAQRTRKDLGQAHPVRRFPWPLSGAIKCFCGRAMAGMATGGANRRVRYYTCKATFYHDGKIRCVRADALEEQFVAILAQLRATPSLVARYRNRSQQDSSADIERDLKSMRRQIAVIEKQRESAWGLHARGLVRDADLQPRLDKLSDDHDAMEARIASLEERLSAAKSLAKSTSDVKDLVRRAPELYRRATVEQRRTLARAVALGIGGLCVEPDGALHVRRVEDAARQRKRSAREI